MNFEDRFLVSLGELISSETGEEGVKALSFDTEVTKAGFCDTCSYDVVEFVVRYTVSGSSERYPRSWTYDGDLGSLMRKMSA